MTHLYGNLDRSSYPLQQRGSHTGRLTSLDRYLEPINFMPRFSGIPVNVRRATDHHAADELPVAGASALSS